MSSRPPSSRPRAGSAQQPPESRLRGEPVTIAAVPQALRGRLEPAELFHKVLDHRWYLSEAAGRDVGLSEAVASFVGTVLPNGVTPELVDVLEDT